jgi:hypothetical protein
VTKAGLRPLRPMFQPTSTFPPPLLDSTPTLAHKTIYQIPVRREEADIGKLMVVLLVLPAIAAAQCIFKLSVQRVWTQDAGGADETTFAPGKPSVPLGTNRRLLGA